MNEHITQEQRAALAVMGRAHALNEAAVAAYYTQKGFHEETLASAVEDMDRALAAYRMLHQAAKSRVVVRHRESVA